MNTGSTGLCRHLPFLPQLGMALMLAISTAVRATEMSDHLNAQAPHPPDYVRSAPAEAFRLPQLEIPMRQTDSSGSVFVRRVVFRGNSVISTQELDGVVAAYTERRLNEADLEMLRVDVTRYYIGHGFVNSGALLKSDALAGDVLTIDIVEGRLRGVRISGMQGLHDAYLVDRLSRGGDEILNVNRLRERFLMALDDPLFKRLNARIEPGMRLGEAVLDIDVERARPYGLSVFANNYRPPSIGSNALGVSGWVQNLTGRGDVLDASLQVASAGSGDVRGSLGWRYPLFVNGPQLTLQLEHGRSSVVEEPMRVLDIRSTVDSIDAGLSQTFVETLNHRFTLGINGVERTNRTLLADSPFSFVAGEPDGVTRISAWRFWQEYVFRTERQALALRSTFTKARNNIRATTGLPSVPEDLANSQYVLWLGQAQFARELSDNGSQIIVRAAVQHTSQRLLSLDRMSIGGVYSVRGFRENQLVRDQGCVLNVEIGIPLARRDSTEFTVTPFYDWGRGRNQNEAADRLSSIGLAVRLRWQGLRIEAAIAHRLHHPANVSRGGEVLQDRSIHLQLAYDLF